MQSESGQIVQTTSGQMPKRLEIIYTPDVRKRTVVHTPPESVMEEWKNDYDTMVANMIYEDKVPTFSDILAGVAKIESVFKG